MRKPSFLFLALMLVAPFAKAQGLLPDMPIPKIEVAKTDTPKTEQPKTADKKFWFMIGTLGASATADYITTSQNIHAGYAERNPVFGTHPSNEKLVLVGGAFFAGEATLAYFLKRYGEHHRWAKYLWLIEPTYSTANHAYLAENNTKHGHWVPRP